MRYSFTSGLFLLALPQTSSLAIAIAADFPRVFHVAGVPDAKRGQRIDISLTDDKLIFEHLGDSFQIPYSRIKQVSVFHATRNYEKTTVAAAAATGALGVPIGALLILKKHSVDTIIVDYENERHGRMGLVVQMEKGRGQEIVDRLKNHGVGVVPPPEQPKGTKDNASRSGGQL